MKSLSDKELAVILEAASYLTLCQHEDTRIVNLAYYLWEIYNHNISKERVNDVHLIRKLLFKH